MSYDDEPAKLFIEHFRVARKRHRCCECRSTIERGEKYHNVFGVWDGPEVYKTCWACHELKRDIEAAENEPHYFICLGCLGEVEMDEDDPLMPRFNEFWDRVKASNQRILREMVAR